MPELLKPNESAFKEPVIAPTPVPTAISATELQTPATPFKVTPAAPATQSAGLEALIGTQNDTFTKDLEAKTKAAEATRTDAFSEILKQYGESQGEVALTDKAYASTVDPAEAELRDINQQIFAEQQASRREIERLQKNPQGLFGGALDQKVQEIQDKSLARQADLSVIQLARQGKFNSAKSIADRAVAARLEQQRTKLEVLKLNYEENKDLFTTAEKREFETKQADRERALDKQEADLKQISDLSLDALQNGAPASVAAQMRGAKTVNEAMQIGGSYIGLLQRQAAQRAMATNNLAYRKGLIELAAAGDKKAIDELGYDPKNLPLTREQMVKLEDLKEIFTRDKNIADRALNNNAGLQSSAGLIRGGVTGAFLESPGGILGAPYTASQKQSFLGDAAYIIKNLTFNKIKELSDQGIKLTPISEKELKAMGDASAVLVSKAQFDENGGLLGFDLPEERVREQLRLVSQHHQKAIDEIMVQMLTSEADRKEVDNL